MFFVSNKHIKQENYQTNNQMTFHESTNAKSINNIRNKYRIMVIKIKKRWLNP